MTEKRSEQIFIVSLEKAGLRGLSFARVGMLCDLRMLCEEVGGTISSSPAELRRQFGRSMRRKDLEVLESRGLIELGEGTISVPDWERWR
jgi:hypothetical protein